MLSCTMCIHPVTIRPGQDAESQSPAPKFRDRELRRIEERRGECGSARWAKDQDADDKIYPALRLNAGTANKFIGWSRGCYHKETGVEGDEYQSDT
jgi:hypothetical protein